MKYHWAVEFEEEGDVITSFYCPFLDVVMLPQVSKLTELKELSLENEWLPAARGSAELVRGPSVDFSDLGALVDLQRLVLPQNVSVASLRFLSKLKQLEHLQVDLNLPVGTGGLNPLGFLAKYLPRIRSMVLFGNPSNFMTTELAKLQTSRKGQ